MYVFNECVYRALDFSLFALHRRRRRETNVRVCLSSLKAQKSTGKYIFATNVVFKIYRLQNRNKRLSYFERYIYDFQAYIRINCTIFLIKLLLLLEYLIFFKFEFDKIRLRSAYLVWYIGCGRTLALFQIYESLYKNVPCILRMCNMPCITREIYFMNPEDENRQTAQRKDRCRNFTPISMIRRS